jgi:hypothetical protein
LWYAFSADNRKTAHLFFRHGLQGFMNFIIWFAREYLLCGDLTDGELPRQTVSGSHGDADIPVSHYPEKFPVIPDDR